MIDTYEQVWKQCTRKEGGNRWQQLSKIFKQQRQRSHRDLASCPILATCSRCDGTRLVICNDCNVPMEIWQRSISDGDQLYCYSDRNMCAMCWWRTHTIFRIVARSRKMRALRAKDCSPSMEKSIANNVVRSNPPFIRNRSKAMRQSLSNTRKIS